MAENKKSFLFYVDWGDTFDQLSNEDAGKLIKHLCDYVRDKNPETNSVLINAVFANMKSTLKRDLDKWKAKSLKNSENAKKRWHANASERTKRNANHADRDKVTDNDNVNDIVKEKETKEQRANKFALRVNAFLQYDKKMREEFISYWTESNEKGKKLRFELQKVFDIGRRLTTWNNRNKEKIPSKTKSPHDNIVTDGDYGVL